jgi:amidohydrolase
MRFALSSRRPCPAFALCLLAAAFGAAPPAPAATDLRAAFLREIDRITPATVEIRHALHQQPELSNRETETAALVARELAALGLEVRTGVARTGIVAVLRGGRPGPTIAVRADMDALPVVEQTDLPFRSTVRDTFLGQEVGVAHACGHDVHTAVLLGLARALTPLRRELPGTVVFLFQPAEEGPPPGERGGASLMIEEGALADPKPVAILALHSMPELTVGQIAFTPGAIWAATDQFTITIRGKQSHGARPEQGIDPIVIGAQVVEALQTIRSRNLSPFVPSVVTVGIFRGGERYNIIPGEVHLEGTVRSFDPAVRATIERRMREILDGVTHAGGGSYELDYQSNAPVTVNDATLGVRLRPALERAVGKANVIDTEPTTAGEDFAFFANVVPGFYFRLGVLGPGTTSGGLHTPTFRADDSAVPVGIRALGECVLELLGAGAGAR